MSPCPQTLTLGQISRDWWEEFRFGCSFSNNNTNKWFCWPFLLTAGAEYIPLSQGDHEAQSGSQCIACLQACQFILLHLSFMPLFVLSLSTLRETGSDYCKHNNKVRKENKQRNYWLTCVHSILNSQNYDLNNILHYRQRRILPNCTRSQMMLLGKNTQKHIWH